jgi:hypothetical protein
MKKILILIMTLSLVLGGGSAATALAAGWYRLVRRETTESENG